MTKFMVSITKHYGSSDITVGLEYDHDITNSSYRQGFKLGVSQIEAFISEYESANLLSATMPSQHISSANVEIAVTEIVKTFHPQTGEVIYKVKGGEYTQFGVTIYPEVMLNYPIESMFEGKKGAILVSGVTAIIDVSGKHKRVISMKGL